MQTERREVDGLYDVIQFMLTEGTQMRRME